MKKNIINRIGQRFGQLVVKEFVETRKDKVGRNQGAWWKCVCECGKEVIIRGGSLQSGQSKSCGCSKLKNGNPLPEGQSAFNIIYNKYKRRAKERYLVFSLSKNEFKKLLQQPCFYCGIKPGQRQKGKISDFIYNGVDRIDSCLGYYPANCVSCCGICNKIKMKLSREDFLQQIYRIIEYQEKDIP